MTVRTRRQFQARVDSLLADNDERDISAEDVRSIFDDLADSIPGLAGEGELTGRVRTDLDQLTGHAVPSTNSGQYVTFDWDEATGDPATEYDELIVHIDSGIREYLFAYPDPPGLELSTTHFMLTSAPDWFVDPDITHNPSRPREVVVRIRAEDSAHEIASATVSLWGIRYTGGGDSNGIFNPRRLSSRTYDWDGSTNPIQVRSGASQTPVAPVTDPSTITDQLEAPTSGFLVISMHGESFEGNATWRLAADLIEATSADPLHIKPTSAAFSASWDLYTDSDAKVFLRAPSGEPTPDDIELDIWHIRLVDVGPSDGLTTVSTDSTLTGDGSEDDPLSVANPAEAGAEQNVQPDWDESDNSSDAFIRNKPDLAPSDAEQNVQPDWGETDTSADSYVRRKPSIPSSFSDLAGQIADAQVPAGFTRDAEVEDAAKTANPETRWAKSKLPTDTLYTALVNAIALASNTDRWPKNKLPADVTYSATLASAITPFLNETRIRTLVNGLITAATENEVQWENQWVTGTGYTAPALVRNDGAAYLCIVDVPANTANSEPGVGSNWESFWYRIGFEDGPPNAVVGMTIEGNVVEARRESGVNPIELRLPEPTEYGPVKLRGNTSQIVMRPGSTGGGAINTQQWTVLTGATVPASPADDDALELEVWFGTNKRTLIVSGAQIKALPTVVADAVSTAQERNAGLTVYEVDSGVIYFFGRTADNELVVTEADANGDPITLRAGIYAMEGAGERGRTGEQGNPGRLSYYQHWSDTPLDGSPAFDVTDVTAETRILNNATYTQTLLSDDLPAGLDLESPIFISYTGILLIGHVGSKKNYLIELGYRLFPSTTNQITFWRPLPQSIANGEEVSDPLASFNTSSMFPPGSYPTDGGGTFMLTQAAFDMPVPFEIILRIRGYGAGDATFATNRADITLGRLEGRELAFTVYQLGPVGGQAPLFTPTEIGTATFSLTGQAQQIALEDGDGNPIISPDSGYLIATFDIPGLGLNGDSELIRADRLRAARSDDDLTAGLYTDAGTHQIYFEVAAHAGGATTGNTILVEHIKVTEAAEPTTPTVHPSISEFNITSGDVSPVVGSIARDTYGYELAIAQPGHATGARIVGFAGARGTSRPTSLSVLKVISSADYHHSTGTVRIPAGISLDNAGDIYTIELQVFESGQAPTADDPISYHDARIVAVAPTLRTSFGVIRSTRGVADITRTDRAGEEVLISTSGSGLGTFTFAGVPGDGHDYIPYFVIPSSFVQPNTFAINNFNANNAFRAAVARTIAGQDYMVYLGTTDAIVDSSANGQSYVLSHS